MTELTLEILNRLIEQLPDEAKIGTHLKLPNLECETCAVVGVYWPSPENPHEHDRRLLRD